MTRSSLRGMIAAIPTPFDAQEDVAIDALASDVAQWADTRLTGLAVLGTTGEFVSLTIDERKIVLERARDAMTAPKTMLAGTGAESTKTTRELSRFAAETGFDYAMVVTPSFLRWMFTEKTILEHYRRVADESAIPILVYHIPGCTGMDLAPDTVSRLAEHENISGIKDSSGDLEALKLLRRVCPADFAILTGAAEILHDALIAGADGAILADACVASDLCVALLDAFESGDHERARSLQTRLAKLSAVLVAECGIPGIKALLERQGLFGGPSRRPLEPLSDNNCRRLFAIFDEVVSEAIHT